MEYVYYKTITKYERDGFSSEPLVEKQTHMRRSSSFTRVILTSKNVAYRGVIGYLILESRRNDISQTGMEHRTVVDTYQVGGNGYYQNDPINQKKGETEWTYNGVAETNRRGFYMECEEIPKLSKAYSELIVQTPTVPANLEFELQLYETDGADPFKKKSLLSARQRTRVFRYTPGSSELHGFFEGRLDQYDMRVRASVRIHADGSYSALLQTDRSDFQDKLKWEQTESTPRHDGAYSQVGREYFELKVRLMGVA
ncbi:MAG: hypothetical protein Rhims3KO_09350 [Hyphomicrobiales bacterium]